MFHSVFSAFLRTPNFRGKARLLGRLRKVLYPRGETRVLPGLKMELDPWEWLQLEIMRNRVTEPLTTKLFQDLLGPGDTCVDVGAHVGFHTLVARLQVGESGQVLAIEPQPYNCERILNNWRINGFSNIKLYVAAAGAKAGSIALPHQPVTDRARLSLADSEAHQDGQRFLVPIIRLDAVLKEQAVRSVRLLKVDVEGFELPVLEGLGESIRQVENLIVEVLPAAKLAPHEDLPLLAWLRDKGYCFRTVEGNDWHPGEALPENNLWVSRNHRRSDG